jgi:hypothetical protein
MIWLYYLGMRIKYSRALKDLNYCMRKAPSPCILLFVHAARSTNAVIDSNHTAHRYVFPITHHNSELPKRWKPGVLAALQTAEH